MKYLILFLTTFLKLSFVFSQQVTFSKIFSNYPLNAENGWEVTEVTDGYLMMSYSSCLGVEPETVCCSVSKTNFQGDVIWFKQYDFYPNPGGLLIKNNRIYLTGSHYFGINQQIVLYCLDMEGEILWQKDFGKEPYSEGGPVLTTINDSTLIICGAFDRTLINGKEQLLDYIQITLEGDSLFSYTYGDSNRASIPRWICNSGSDHVTAYIFCHASCGFSQNAGAISYDDAGNMNWNVELPSSELPKSPPSIIQTDSETLAVSWNADTLVDFPFLWDSYPPAIYYINPADGQIKHKVVLHNQSLYEIVNMTPVDGGLVGCGSNYVDKLTTDTFAGWVFRMSPTRQMMWNRTYRDTTHGGFPFAMRHIIHTSDGGYLIAATMNNTMTGVLESHNWLLKLDSMGCLEPGCGTHNVVTGTSDAVWLQGEEIALFPNPASTTVNISFPDHFSMENTRVLLLSQDGRLVRQWRTSDQITRLDVSMLPGGVYSCIVLRNNAVLGVKPVLVVR